MRVFELGTYVGKTDMEGTKIRVGDTIMYPPSVWGCSKSNKAVVVFDQEEGCFFALGCYSEWDEYALIVKKWNE